MAVGRGAKTARRNVWGFALPLGRLGKAPSNRPDGLLEWSHTYVPSVAYKSRGRSYQSPPRPCLRKERCGGQSMARHSRRRKPRGTEICPFTATRPEVSGETE